MAETDDDVRPLALGGHLDPVAVAKVARKVLLILTPAIAALAAAVCGAIYSVAGGAQAKAAYAKNAAEAGYQETRHAVEELQGRVGELQKTVRQLSTQQHPPARRGSRPRAAPPVPPAPPPPRQLPLDLDQAQRQIYRGARPQAVEPARDGGP